MLPEVTVISASLMGPVLVQPRPCKDWFGRTLNIYIGARYSMTLRPRGRENVGLQNESFPIRISALQLTRSTRRFGSTVPTILRWLEPAMSLAIGNYTIGL